jgi:hypothetical protein
MRIVHRLICLSLLLGLSVAALAQSPFAGKWQTKTVRRTGKPPVTINIVATGNNLSGTIILVSPNGTEDELRITDPEVSENVLTFHTKAPSSFDWHMTLNKNGRTASLHGNDRPGEGGEMVIEEKLKKKR